MRMTLARPKLLESLRAIMLNTWLAEGPRYRVRYTPTDGPILLQTEKWFRLITRNTARRGPDHALRDLGRSIATFAVG